MTSWRTIDMGLTRYLDRNTFISGLGLFCKTGTYVSGTIKKAGMPKKAAIINVIHDVHRQPRPTVMYVPRIGP